jgi:hypothetical protein
MRGQAENSTAVNGLGAGRPARDTPGAPPVGLRVGGFMRIAGSYGSLGAPASTIEAP